MTLRTTKTHGTLAALGCLLASACSGGDGGNGNAPPQNYQGNGGFGGYVAGSGGFPQGGAFPGNGGFGPGAGGGIQPGAGGFQQGAGGFNPGVGGGIQAGAGGFDPGAGGFNPSAGGFQPGAGGEINPGAGGQAAVTNPPCITDPGQQAAIIGDSYVTGFLSPTLLSELGKLVPAANQYAFYAGAGCSMASGGACTGAFGNVPQQATTALQQHPNLKFLLMDGGGNDILICDVVKYPGCNTACNAAGASSNQVCTSIVQGAIDASTKLMQDGANAGVRDTIYFFYPHIPAQNGGYSEILDYALPRAKALCDGAEATTGGKLRCHFIDLVPVFAAAGGAKNAANFAGDGIHPSAAGQALIAKEIQRVMQENCLGQTSGCCTP